MAKVTSKLQVTVPKAIADRFGIRPGDEIEWRAEGNTIRVLPRGEGQASADSTSRLRSFDEATARQASRNRSAGRQRATSRGWTRDDLYDRARPR
jgi:AbrB family looped-hinge helix DNA binding protein